MYKIEELKGIILGINYDGVINPLEVKKLSNWLDKNRNLSLDSKFTNLIKGIEDILEDNVIDDDERKKLMQYIDKYVLSSSNICDHLNELNGIIEGIVCDNVLNEQEISNLQNWLQSNSVLSGIPVYENINNLVNQIIEDKVITAHEQHDFLELINSSIIDSKTNLRIDYLKQKVKKHEIIGIDLIELIDDESVINKIHKLAEAQLYKSLTSYSGLLLCDTEIIFISLVLIALIDYDARFYEKVANTYENLYKHYSEVQISNQIREIIRKYNYENNSMSNGRLINKIIEHTIVPKHFLPAFFEFIFDIYEKNFGFSTTVQDIHDEFKFIYNGIKKNLKLTDDNLNLNVTQKTYKLIKSTKELILNDPEFTDIIKLSTIVINLIDSNFWNDEEPNIQNPYFKYGYTKWLDSFHKRVKYKNCNELKISSRWTTKFTYYNESIVLNPFIFKTNKEISFEDIHILIENKDEVLFSDYSPIIEPIFGGFAISTNENITIDNPLGELKYIIYEKNKILYSSDKKLFRDVLFFNYDNKEIYPNKNFKGDLIVIHKQTSEAVNDFVNCPNYKIGQSTIDIPNILMVDNVIYKFSSINVEGVSGDLLEQHLIYQNNQKYPVYRNVNYITIQSEYPSTRLGIRINNKEYAVSNFNYDCQIKNNYYETTISFSEFGNGIYNISFFNLITKENIKKSVFKIAIDDQFSSQINKIDDYNYIVICDSSFFEHKEDIYHINDIPYLQHQFILNHMSYNYQFPVNLCIYKLDELDWKPLSEPIFKKYIKSNSKLYIYGSNTDQVKVYGNTFEYLDSIPMKKDSETINCLDVGVIKKYQTYYDTIHLGWLYQGNLIGICCYNHNVLNTENSYFNFDHKKNILYMSISFMGREKMTMNVKDSDNNIVFQIENIKNEEIYSFDKVKSGTEYTFELEEISRIGLKISKRSFKPYKMRYYGCNYLKKHIFRINYAYYSPYSYTTTDLSKIKLFNTYIWIVNYHGNYTYSGIILIKKENDFYTYENFKLVEIKINNIDGYIANISIKKNMQYMLLDRNHKTISSSLTCPDFSPIIGYTINLNHYKKLNKEF